MVDSAVRDGEARSGYRALPAVCLLSGEFPPDSGGVGEYTARLAEALVELGARLVVLTARRPDQPARRSYVIADRGITIPVLGLVPSWDVRGWPIVARTMSKLGSGAILHIQYQTGAFDLQGAIVLLPLWLRARKPATRTVTTFHDFRPPYLFPKAGPLRLGANRLLARTSDVAIFTDPGDLALAGVPGEVVPIGSNIDPVRLSSDDRLAARERLGADNEITLVGYFGFLNASKGVPTLLRAIGALVAAGRRVRLALIGAEASISDPTDLVQARIVHTLIGELGLVHHVAFTGRLAAADVSTSLQACDLVALPFVDGASARRGTLMAAFAHGLPVVSTVPPATAGASEAGEPISTAVPLRDGEQLVLVRPEDPTALATAIARLADDGALRAHLSRAARALAGTIAWPRIGQRTLELYRRAGEAAPARRWHW